jgi:uncharacterized protein YraI
MKMNTYMRILTIVIVIMSLFTFTSIAMAETTFNGHTTTTVNIRTTPSVNGVYFTTWAAYAYRDVQTFHNFGTTANREWLKVLSTDDSPMYVCAKYIKYTGTMNATITGSGVNLRVSPNTSSEIIKTMPLNTRVKILESITNWVRITCKYGTGWVYYTYVQAD